MWNNVIHHVRLLCNSLTSANATKRFVLFVLFRPLVPLGRIPTLPSTPTPFVCHIVLPALSRYREGKMRHVAILFSALLAGCMTTQPEVQQVWMRTDGRPMASSATLQQQFETDKIICDGEVQKASLSHTERPYLRNDGLNQLIDQMAKDKSLGTVSNGCMASRGYVLVNEAEAANYSVTARTARR